MDVANVSIALAIIAACTVRGTYGNYEREITNDLLKEYGQTNTRPLRNASHIIDIKIRILVAQIVNFDEPNQQITLHAWNKLAWRDEFLVWDPDDYGGRDKIYLMPSSIWKPIFVLQENVNYDFPSSKEVEVEVHSDGSLIWYTPTMYHFSCRVYVRNFPFDKQRCKMSFTPWVYDMSTMNLSYFDDEDTEQYVFKPNGVWNLVAIEVTREEVRYVCCEHPFPTVVYTLTFQRAFLVYIFSILIPSTLLTLISLTVFCIPPESGEKISLSITNLLTFIVFQQLIGDNMPPIGDETPVITVYIFSMVVMGCASIVVSVCVLKLFHMDPERRVPPTVVRLSAGCCHPKRPTTWQTLAMQLDSIMMRLFVLLAVGILITTYLAFAF